MRRASLAGVTRSILVGVFVGAAVGAVVGGLGGRAAMRLVAVWTDGPPFTIGGNEVGVVSLAGTLTLMGKWRRVPGRHRVRAVRTFADRGRALPPALSGRSVLRRRAERAPRPPVPRGHGLAPAGRWSPAIAAIGLGALTWNVVTLA